jgi:X-Pro dipeptidyl-peptidase-like protein
VGRASVVKSRGAGRGSPLLAGPLAPPAGAPVPRAEAGGPGTHTLLVAATPAPLRGIYSGRTAVASDRVGRPLMASCLLSLALLSVLLPTVAGAATVASVFGGRVPCAEESGIQFCAGSLATRVPSWDGVPLDVNVTLPPAAMDGPFPLIVELHGWSLGKTPTPFVDRALAGYIVLSYSARGFQGSCGTPASRAPDPTLANPNACLERGWVRLADARYEGRDTQHLAGLLVDEGLVSPDRIGVTGASYGGGQSMILAALHDRVMLPDGTLVPWQSPGGLPMTIAAAAPQIPWSNLAEALAPAGRTLDYRSDNPYGTRAGIQKQSWNALLYALGLGTGFYVPAGADPEADLPSWNARLSAGEPYDGEPVLEHALAEISSHHSAYGIDDAEAPAPLFIYNAWTDDLFPADEALRFYRKLKAHHPDAEIALHFADGFGHPRAGLGGDTARVQARIEAFFARHLLGSADPLWKDHSPRPTGTPSIPAKCASRSARPGASRRREEAPRPRRRSTRSAAVRAGRSQRSTTRGPPRIASRRRPGAATRSWARPP